jgi:hypothetical protein
MTDSDEPTGADEPTRISEPTPADGDLPGTAASTTPGRRVDGSVDPPEQPVWKRPPVIIGAVAAVIVLALLAFFLLKDDGDTEPAATDDKDTTSQSSTTLDPLNPTSETTAPPETTATTSPGTDPEGTTNQTPTTPVGTDVCQAYNAIEDAVALVFDSGDLSDADVVSRSHELADGLDRSVGLLRSMDDRPYGADATTYADFLDPMADEFREATTREQVEAAGDKLFQPPVDISEADTRLQDEYDAQCG